jgi:exopolysaccharide biosynthesis polyprenyl glycosylphosphotransferase
MILESPEMETRVIGFLDYRRKGLWRHRDVPLVGHPDVLEQIVANTQVDALFWAVEPLDIPRAWSVLKTAEKMGVTVFVMPSVYEPKLARIRPTYVNGMPAMVYRSDPEDQVALLCKNLVDRIGALVGLLLFSPIMLLTALAVKLTSPGPIFFGQKRSGHNGRQFMLYKFRTMCSDAEQKKAELMAENEMSGPVFKMSRDPRITPIGKFLRKFSIDELPQLFNVLRGEMSLVGPRPPLPKEVSQFEPWQHRKLSVKPGLTCLWQVNGRNNIDFEEWMRLDLEYIDNWSLLLDTKILLKTVPAVLSGSGR